MFDSSMVNEPSGFEPLKFYCTKLHLRGLDTHGRLAAITDNGDYFCDFQYPVHQSSPEWGSVIKLL